MKNIQLSARFKIHKGKEETFKNIANECVEIIKKEGPASGCLQYDWFFNADNSECVVRENYADNNALMAHMGQVGELLGKLLEISDFFPEIYGNPSKEFMEVVAPLNPKVYSFFKGM